MFTRLGWLAAMLRAVAALVPATAAMAQGAPTSLPVAAVRALPLVDQDDRPFTLEQMLGSVTVLNFVYTGCGGQCPMQTAQLAAVQAALPPGVSARVQFISVSVDPEHDFPALLRQFAVERGADLGHWRFVTGAPADIAAIGTFFGARPPPGRGLDPITNHSTAVQLFDARGQGLMRYGGAPLDEARLLADLAYLVAPAAP